jgi:hypothetical protein
LLSCRLRASDAITEQSIKKAGLRTTPFVSIFSGKRNIAPRHFTPPVRVPVLVLVPLLAD